MIGTVGPDSAKFLFRADATRRAALHLGPLGAPLPVVAWIYPEASRDFVGEPEVLGLLPDTDYVYFLEIDDVVQGGLEIFRTAPEVGAPVDVSIAFGSCSRYDDQPIWPFIQALDPDLFFFIGDNHYANSADLNALRWYYRWGMERAGRAELLASVPSMATWDDHDYVGNNTDGDDAGKETALRVFDEYWANPSGGTEATPGVFFSWSHGDIDFFFLDVRYYRGFDNSILGAEQTQWLYDGLDASTATFKLLLSGSQWTSHGSSDSWATFPEATAALYEHIRDQAIDGVVLLSGDVHRSEFRLNPGADGGYDFPEIVSSPLANSQSSCGGDGELLACFNSSSYWATLDIDTTVADATLLATIWDETGVEMAAWMILASELE
jgi:alkaline phosphatase D